MIPFKVDDIVKATVFATPPFGIYLRYAEINILVEVTDIPWATEISTSEFTKVGEELEVRIIFIDEGEALEDAVVKATLL